MSPAEERNLKMLQDAYIEHQLNSDWDYVLAYIHDDLVKLDRNAKTLQDFLTNHGWEVSYNEVINLVKELQ